MNMLIVGLFAEGRTDERFLPVVIQRTSELILAQYDRTNIEALVPIVSTKYLGIVDRAKSIEQAAHEAGKYHALIVHSDADNRTYRQTRAERFDPGYELVQQSSKPVCKNLVPIIPVRMVEAWMLADGEKLLEILGAGISTRELGFFEKVKQVETYRDPKEVLKQVIKKAYPNQSKQWNRLIGELYTDLAPVIRLERLKQLSAYQQFVNDLTDTLKKLNFIQ